jgi:hypothetical protein
MISTGMESEGCEKGVLAQVKTVEAAAARTSIDGFRATM